MLRRLASIQELNKLPWLVGGDFNEICFDSEKLRGNLRPASQTKASRDDLHDCSLLDIHCQGEFLTWVNRRSPDQLIFEQLDRFCGTVEWRMLFPTVRVISLEFFHSDHRPLLIDLNPHHTENLAPPRKGKHIFRFEACWLADNECLEVVRKSWRPKIPGR